jgi:PKHD-type hydroxylase
VVDKTSVDPYGLTKLDEKQLNIIEKIISDCELELHDAILLDDEDSSEKKEDLSVRSCKTGFLPVNDELTELFGKLIQDYNLNFSGWRFDIEFIEAIQLGHYHKGDFYDWHIDSFQNPSFQTQHEYHPNKPYNRKISVTVFLNDPEEYEGGEFDLETRGPNSNERYDTFKMPKGSVIVFPSYMWHRVRPVTSGVRKSLVLWIQGPPFK